MNLDAFPLPIFDSELYILIPASLNKS